jgi:SAM-dependent methyltransferase
MPAIHDAAARGFQASSDAYERGRPEYPEAAIACLAEATALSRARVVADLGAGTGKLTRLLPSWCPGRVIAVEPVEGMRRNFAELQPGIEIVAGTAEELPLADGSVDAVVAAQAFHWFSGERALAEIRRVLRPGGRLGLIWNVRDESIDWVDELTRIIDPHEGGAPRYRSGLWREAFVPGSGFSPLEQAEFRHVHAAPPEAIVDRIASISFIASLEGSRREAVLGEVRQLLSNHPATHGRSTVALSYRTDVYWCSSEAGPTAGPARGTSP